MAYKTGGTKVTYVDRYGPYSDEYTIYRAVESVTDTATYVMKDPAGRTADICIAAEDDCAEGNGSIIECLHCLRTGNDLHTGHPEFDIIVNPMTDEEMEAIFGR